MLAEANSCLMQIGCAVLAFYKHMNSIIIIKQTYTIFQYEK